MSNDVECRRCGRTVPEKSIREGWHTCDEAEAMGDLRDRVDSLENIVGRNGGSPIEAIAYATAALGYAVAGEVDRFNECMGAAARKAPFDWDFEPTRVRGLGRVEIPTREMALKAAKLLDAIGDDL